MSENFTNTRLKITMTRFLCRLLFVCLLGTFSYNMKNNEYLKVGTFNSKGHSEDCVQYVKQLMVKCDLLVLQQHWFNEGDITCLESQIPNAYAIGKSGMDEEKLLIGRPFGGLTIIYKDTLHCTVTPLNVENKVLCICYEFKWFS